MLFVQRSPIDALAVESDSTKAWSLRQLSLSSWAKDEYGLGAVKAKAKKIGLI